MRCTTLHEMKYWFLPRFKAWVYFKNYLLHCKTRVVLLIPPEVFWLLWEALGWSHPPATAPLCSHPESETHQEPLFPQQTVEARLASPLASSPWVSHCLLTHSTCSIPKLVLKAHSVPRLSCFLTAHHTVNGTGSLGSFLIVLDTTDWEFFYNTYFSSGKSTGLSKGKRPAEMCWWEQSGRNWKKKIKKPQTRKKSLFFCWEGGISAEDSPGPYTQHTPLQQPPAPLPAASAGISSLRWSPQIRIQISLGFFFLRLEKQAMPLLDYSSAVLMS